MKKILLLILVALLMVPSISSATGNTEDILNEYHEKLIGTWGTEGWYSFKYLPSPFTYPLVQSADGENDEHLELFCDAAGHVYLRYSSSGDITVFIGEVMFGLDSNRILLFKDGTSYVYVRQ